ATPSAGSVCAAAPWTRLRRARARRPGRADRGGPRRGGRAPPRSRPWPRRFLLPLTFAWKVVRGGAIVVLERDHARCALAVPDVGSVAAAAGAVLLHAARGPRDGRARRLRPDLSDGHGHPAPRAEQAEPDAQPEGARGARQDRKSTRLNSSHVS